MKKSLKPHQLIIFSFFITICIGAMILALPLSSGKASPIGIIDAFFTATSATCVTGLTVKDTGVDFSRFGQIVILILIQMGGLGIMTLSTFFAVLLGKKLTLKENVTIKSALDHSSVEGFQNLLWSILLMTFSIELIGAGFLYLRFGSIYSAAFHSISAFCNAGFGLYTDNLMQYRGDVLVNLVISGLIILGGIGFVVMIDIRQIFKNCFNRTINRASLQTKLALSMTLALLIIGTLVIFILENGRSFVGFSLKDKILASFFQSVTSRTAGFNTVSIGGLASPTLFFMIILMFIGASPGGTGGGIKTCTFGILLAGAVSMTKNREEISIFKRTIPKDIFRKAVMIASLSIAIIVVLTMLLSVLEQSHCSMPDYFLKILFEITSAFGTVGLSTGITSTLGAAGKIIVMIMIFIGRIGPLTLAIAFAAKDNVASYSYPKEKIMVV